MIKIELAICFWDTFTIQSFTLTPKWPFVVFVGPSYLKSQFISRTKKTINILFSIARFFWS